MHRGYAVVACFGGKSDLTYRGMPPREMSLERLLNRKGQFDALSGRRRGLLPPKNVQRAKSKAERTRPEPILGLGNGTKSCNKTSNSSKKHDWR